jgi:hypothetical protein
LNPFSEPVLHVTDSFVVAEDKVRIEDSIAIAQQDFGRFWTFQAGSRCVRSEFRGPSSTAFGVRKRKVQVGFPPCSMLRPGLASMASASGWHRGSVGSGHLV